MFKFSVITIAILILSACSISGTSEGQVFTLYRNSVTDGRNSVTDGNMRLHVATFDATETEEYNRGNCEQAQQLFQSQQGVKTKFWCEKGRFRK